MYTVFTTLNNSLTFVIFKSCILKDYTECIELFYNARDRYNDKTYKRVFEFVWTYGLKHYYRTLHSLMRDRQGYELEYNALERHIHKCNLEELNKLIQKFKSKGGVLK